MCPKRRVWSACAFLQSDQNRIFTGHILDSQGFKVSSSRQQRPIRLCRWAGWFESLFGKHVRRYIFYLAAILHPLQFQCTTLCNWFVWKTKSNQKWYCIYPQITPALVAQLDARLTGDQEVTGWTPAEVGNILSWRLIVKYFLRSFSPFRWFKKGSCQFLAKECARYWLTA